MDLLYVMLAGVAGTLLMTFFMDLASLATGYYFHVPRILGTMITMSTKPSGAVSKSPVSIISGYGAHYFVGILFSVIYYTAMQFGQWPDNILHATIFGVLAGMSALLFWFMALKLHPLAPAIKLNLYLVFIFIGHLLFSAGMHFGFLLLVTLFKK